MGLKPIGDNRQRQPLTTTLKNICRDYPAGGTVLRELLQNADDAGATEVKFVLDERTHPTSPLIHTELAKYQGPALLAFNNAVFTNKDFESLSRLGDSLKLDDGTTTGKFGRGFNSVYNWTDSPSIISRDRLLILDPHEEWSPGGNVYDFVAKPTDPEDATALQNNLAAFKSILDTPGKPLDGTIIRIPLRTSDQALESKILEAATAKATTVSEVSEVLQSFASEFGDSGLLFMRNIEKLEIKSVHMSIMISVTDSKTLRSNKTKVNNAVALVLKNPRCSFDHSFEMDIQFKSGKESSTASYLVHHCIQGAEIDAGLQEWAQSQKLIPWAAVAARISPTKSTDTTDGSLFTVLPLPIKISQPLKIHGMFSLTPDRARLHELGDSSTQNQNPAKWNAWLFQQPIPIAWTKLLSCLAQLQSQPLEFQAWPHIGDSSNSHLRACCDKVLEIIDKEWLAVWPTHNGYANAKKGLLTISIDSIKLKEALQAAGVLLVHVPQRLVQPARKSFGDRILDSQNLCHFLKNSGTSWNSVINQKILACLLSESGFIDERSLVSFLQWLKGTSSVESATSEERHQIGGIVSVHLSQDSKQRESVSQAMRTLTLFQAVSWKLNNHKMERFETWTSLDARSTSVGLLDGVIPVPEIAGFQFLIASTPLGKLLKDLKLADCIGPVTAIQNHIVPAWQSNLSLNWTFAFKEHLATFILKHLSLLPLDVQAHIRKLPMVPVAQLNGKETLNFASAEELIDPSVSLLRVLCFDNEEVLPKQSLFSQFDMALRVIGLKTSVDDALIESRVRCYSSGNYSVEDVRDRAQHLLASFPPMITASKQTNGSGVRNLAWLPTLDHSGILSLKASTECRGPRSRLLVSAQLPILTTTILPQWEARLGWYDKLPSHTLLSQLKYGIQEKDREIVDAVLRYISINGLAGEVAEELRGLQCVLGSDGSFYQPSKAFQCDCDGLQPYLVKVDQKFLQDHENLLTIGKKPQPQDLLTIQAVLESKTTLDESDTSVAVEVLKLASKYPRISLPGLKILSNAGKFESIQDICYDDLGQLLESKEKVNLTHPDVTLTIAKRLGIDSLKDRLIKGMLEIKDVDDDDEFDQRESVSTRIADTLKRYPVETTFREYLANADDAGGASTVSWLLDERHHPKQDLLTPEMKSFQGPAFLSHNDGVFTDDDWAGFKKVGQGSKADNQEKIGQFGRGSQTMYHWTDVPMILSGKFLVILDPQQEVLPKNQIKGQRKPGVKLELSKLREACPDQLAPFEGLWGYTQSVDNYAGTIFRFPLRTPMTKSALRSSKYYLDANNVYRLMETYFNEARNSLLFLRRIVAIEFSAQVSAQGNQKSFWSVNRDSSANDDELSFSTAMRCSFSKHLESGTRITGHDNWWVAIEDLPAPAADVLPDSSWRVMKNVECGMAALMSTHFDNLDPKIVPPKPLEPRIFNTLPLPIISDLPVHIHATFYLSGDRQTIAIEEQGTQSSGAKWNRQLLQDDLPRLYLTFLDNIGPKVRQGIFGFFPQKEPPKRSCAELLCASFWKELRTSSQRVFPKASPSTFIARRQAATLFDINQAVFDFLPPMQSNTLEPLLTYLNIPLVRSIPSEVVKHLKNLPELKCVSGQLLREELKTDKARAWLAKKSNMALVDNVLKALFREIIPLEPNLEELDGCHILPLADGSLDTLTLISNEQSKTFYVASDKELKLFPFALNCLVSSSIAKYLGSVVSSGKFNVTALKLCNVKQLLTLRSNVSTPDSNTDKWLADFWVYWSGHADSADIDALPGKLLRATRDGVPTYMTAQEFRQLPAVVEPALGEHQHLCQNIPGTYRVDPKFLPRSIADAEKSFVSKSSFARLMKALRTSNFVAANLNHTDLKILRDLTVTHTRNEILSDKSFSGLEGDLKSMPLWPNFHPDSPNPKYLSAKKVLAAENTGLIVPWMKNATWFVDPDFSADLRNSQCLSLLGVQVVPTDKLLKDYVLPLPKDFQFDFWILRQARSLEISIPLRSSLVKHRECLVCVIVPGFSCYEEIHQTHGFDEYVFIWKGTQGLINLSGAQNPLLDTLSSIIAAKTKPDIDYLLKHQIIAADGDCNMRKVSDLFDHDDEIFISAFRDQEKSMFLHPTLRPKQLLWVKCGLRRRQQGYFNPDDYSKCLEALSSRLSASTADSNLVQDIQKVLSPLTSSSHNLSRLTVADWKIVAQQKVFVSRMAFNSEPEYRRSSMNTVALQRRLMSLSEIVLYDHVAVCWSQTAFTVLRPAHAVLDVVVSKGRPSDNMVWRHLEVMKKLSQHLKRHELPDFLSDLQAIYNYLQVRLQDSSHTFDSTGITKLEDSALWLNLSSLDHKTVLLEDVKSCWYKIDHLVLSSSCDAGEMKAVKSGLMRFERLLRGMGCKTITYPTVMPPQLHVGRSVTHSLRLLREEGKLLDVTFHTEGREIKAHRVVLAAMSKVCAAQAKESWNRPDVDFNDFMSFHTVSTMVQYAYEDEIDWQEMQVADGDDSDAKADKLDLLLDLLTGADYWDVSALRSQVENKILVAGREFINLENVEEVLERSSGANANALKDMCAKFIEQNRDAVEQARSGR